MRRFFADNSFWNTPIGNSPQIDPRNDHYLQLLAGPDGGPFWINLKKYTIPVYEADARTPRYTVHQRTADNEWVEVSTSKWSQAGFKNLAFRQGPGFGRDVPIPDHAQPDPAGDSHMAIVDWSTRTAWDMWRCYRRPDGQWESNTGMVYSLDSSGVWQPGDFAVQDGQSIHFHGPSRAAGVPAVAGLIMYDEIQAGHIAHKLAFATWYNAYKNFVAPATWTDGFVDDGLPEGAVMQLNPALEAADFGLSPAGCVIFRALQEYGMVNTDCAKGNVLYGEGLYAHPTRTWAGLLEEGEMKKVPLKHYRVLKLGQIIAKGDSRGGSQY